MQFKLSSILYWVLLCGISLSTSASEYWQSLKQDEIVSYEKRYIAPQKAAFFQLDLSDLEKQLQYAPHEFDWAQKSNFVEIELPTPDNTLERFKVWESPIMAEGLAKKFPNIKTYVAKGIDDPRKTARLDISHKGFHGMILGGGNAIFIDPYTMDDTEHYTVYYKKDYQASEDKIFECWNEEVKNESQDLYKDATTVIGEELRVYRLAVSATIEYTAFHGGTVEDGLAAVVTTINRVVGIYRNDLAISMELVENNDLLIFVDEDEFDNNSSGLLINQNTLITNQTIGIDAYDIGHIFSTGGGGQASIGSVCIEGNKAKGVTGISNPIGDPFDIDYVAHEIGHQFGAYHSFNGNISACSGNRWAASAYEPGSGSTIMGYPGICGNQNLQPNADAYFHATSQAEIVYYTTNPAANGSECPQIIETGNTAPTVDVSMAANHVIPIGTPFELTGAGADADGNESLTYCWEEWDKGPPGHPNDPVGDAPIFRSFNPSESPTRIFPQMSDILNNTQSIGELLPTYERNMLFRLTVRDNHESAGGHISDLTLVQVKESAGPFAITSPNESATWLFGETASITWEVANTDAAPINCAEVDILVSTNGGQTFDYALAENLPNNGTAEIVIPTDFDLASNNARIKLKCSDNIFFDINDAPLQLTGPFVSVASETTQVGVCSGGSNTFLINVDVVEAEPEAVTLVAENLPPGAGIIFSENPVVPPAQVQATIEVVGSIMSQETIFNIMGESNLQTMPLSIDLVIQDAEMDGPMLVSSPPDGMQNVQTGTTFSWFEVEEANTYTFELASSPGFGEDILEIQAGIDTTTYTPIYALEDGKVYYWRVSPQNACATNELSALAAFGTISTGNNPSLVVAMEFCAFAETTTDIGAGFLSVSDDNAPEEISYVLRSVPLNGSLWNANTLLGIGDHFTQADINETKLYYKHENPNILQDVFMYDVVDVNGGWLPNQIFAIDFCSVGIDELNANTFKVYPNPTNTHLMVDCWVEDASQDLELELVNSMGQVVVYKNINVVVQGQNLVTIDVKDLVEGVYFCRSNLTNVQQKVVVIH